jgi:hypothetical protein
MFGRPECPLQGAENAWVEYRLGWLAEKFGARQIHEMSVVTPTDDFFPLSLDGTEAAAQRMFDHVCGLMEVDPSGVRFEVFEDDKPLRDTGLPMDWSSDGAAGYYEGDVVPTVAVEQEQLSDPMQFVATVAHELCHVRLLGGGLLTGDEYDHEQVTDLMTVYCGMGIFGANARLTERQYESLGMHGWSTSRKGYLDFPTWGYAHALVAWARGEKKPEWAKHLRPDVRAPFNQGLKYLQKTGDSAFRV